jgi:uncharacterized protein YyaL (SSP411 family)
MQPSSTTHRNRLANESSPYLLQHAGNPVDWYPWGEEALELAQRLDKPILLSIGYSACHWCHVMAHESFEDPACAALMNELFVNIKVDREERPDLDRIYQIAHQMLIQRGGGWPLTMFLSPHTRRPFFGGTYFPNQPRYGMPSFGELLRRVSDFYRDHAADIARQSEALQQAFDAMLPPPAAGDVARASGSPRASMRSSAASAQRRSSRIRPTSTCCSGPGARARRAMPPTCIRCTWRRSRSGAWPTAASTTSSAAASRAIPSTSTG